MADVPVFRGKFGERQAERLLWRAGFGPRPGEARKLARRFNLKGAVRSLTRPKGKVRLSGRAPVDDDGLPIAPFDVYGHDMLWWLDRMVRSNRPFEERMALIWHDWFATDADSQQLAIEQCELFRGHATSSFLDLLLDVTVNPAMLIWLSGIDNTKRSPNENYGRELMELFTLGASDDSGHPYSETDVREQARALTGWRATWVDDVGYQNFRFDPARHDPGPKTILGKTGNFDWADSCRLCVEHPAHRTFFVTKLWSYFIPKPPPAKTLRALERLYVERDYAVGPVVERILMHPALYQGPAMVKPPAVYIAGLLRARRQTIRTDSWTWISARAGQRLFRPPNVSGWDDERWLDTSTFGGRWIAANEIAGPGSVDPERKYNEMQARGSEFDLVLSKQRVRPGRVIVQFLNEGEDPHDLRLARVDATGAPAGPETGLEVLAPATTRTSTRGCASARPTACGAPSRTTARSGWRRRCAPRSASAGRAARPDRG